MQTFKIDKLESTFCLSNDCGHVINNNGVCIDWPLHINDSTNIQSISGMLNELMDPRGKLLQDYRCDRCHRVNTTTKAVYPTQVFDILLIQLNAFRFIYGTVRKVTPNVNIDQEISLWGNLMTLTGIIYHEGDQPNYGHYTCGVRIEDAWYLISDTVVLRNHKVTSMQGASSVPYIIVYKKRHNIVSSLYNSAAERWIRRSLVNELDKQKDFVEEKIKQNKTFLISSNNKSSVKRKKQFAYVSSKERVKVFRENLDDDVKITIKNVNRKKKKEMRDNLNDDIKNTTRNANRNRMKETPANLDDDLKNTIRNANREKMKETRAKLDDDVKKVIRNANRKK